MGATRGAPPGSTSRKHLTEHLPEHLLEAPPRAPPGRLGCAAAAPGNHRQLCLCEHGRSSVTRSCRNRVVTVGVVVETVVETVVNL